MSRALPSVPDGRAATKGPTPPPRSAGQEPEPEGEGEEDGSGAGAGETMEEAHARMKAEIALDKLHAERKWNSSGAVGDRHKHRHKRGALGAEPNFWAEERTLLVICTFVFIFDVLTVYWMYYIWDDNNIKSGLPPTADLGLLTDLS